MVQVLIGEKCESDGLWTWFNDEFRDIGMESTIPINTDVCWLFALNSDTNCLWFYMFVLKRECRDTHESSCIAI